MLGVAYLCCRPASAQTAAAPAPQSPPAAVATLNPGAVVHVTVAGTPSLTGDYTVDAGGGLQMLYIKEVPVTGLTAAEVAARLASDQYLGRYYRHPQVLVTLISVGGLSVEVTGSVTTQGARLMRPDAGLNELLQQAGPALDADLTQVQVTHGLPGATHTTDKVDYLSFLNSHDTAGDPGLRDGDVVFVPRKGAVQITVSVRGEVAKPGQAAVPAKATVYDALQTAGGLLPDAERAGITLTRADTGDQIPFDYLAASQQPGVTRINPVLRDGDTILVKAAEVSNDYTITGAVLKPGPYPITTPHITLADAIGKAGGTADSPKLRQVTILRKTPGGRVRMISLDATERQTQADTLIQPGDDINIPQGQPKTHHDPLQVLGTAASLFSLLRL